MVLDRYPCVAMEVNHASRNGAGDSFNLTGVWVTSEDKDGTHLTAHWIDDRADSREARLQDESRFGEKEGETCWRTTLYFVWDSP